VNALLGLTSIKAAQPQCGVISFQKEPVRMRSTLTAGDLQVVTRTALFRPLRAEVIEQIIAPAAAMMLRPRGRLTRQEDPAKSFFIVIDGWLKVYRSAASGEETVITMLKKGDSYPESVALTGGRYLASSDAVTEARVARIPADHLVRCIRLNPELALSMIASTSHQLGNLIEQVEQLKAHSGVQRVAEFISSMCGVDHGSCAVVLPYDKVIIASRLGLTPEYLSRAFARLRNLGVIVNASRVTVQDVRRLRNWASEDSGVRFETQRRYSTA
jgi:CRP-like cAMP-binding protein